MDMVTKTMAPAAAVARLRRRTRIQHAPASSASVRSFFSWMNASPSTTESEEASPQPAPIHIPVLLDETVSLWVNPLIDKSRSAKQRKQAAAAAAAAAAATDEAPVVDATPRFFVDGTTGFGGHSKELLLRNPHAHLLCIDRDPEILAIARSNLADFRSRVVFHNGSYADLSTELLRSVHFPDEVHGICVDLGANSFHFDEARRGFSYMRDGPLDMRYNQQDGDSLTAAQVLNTFSEVQLTKIFREFGEERLAKEYAKAIVRDRDEKGVVFRNTSDLRECIERIARKWNANATGANKKKKKASGSIGVHPATKCFQALRIYVNDELTHVAAGVEQLVTQLAPTGRLATIAFHSLEDRPIKQLFRRLDMFTQRMADDEYEDYFDDEFDDHDHNGDDDDDDESSEMMRTQDVLKRLGTKRFELVKRKAIKAKKQEIEENPRSRSARLRCLERVM